MGFKAKNEGIAGSVFLAFYVIYVCIIILYIRKFAKKKVGIMLLIFGLVRMGAQICGVAFASLGIEHTDLLVAYLVLGAEGYFLLIYTLLVSVKQEYESKIGRFFFNEPILKRIKQCPLRRGLKRAYEIFSYFLAFYILLIAANGMVIGGGTMMSSASELDPDGSEYKSRLNTSRILRGTGQSLFLALTVLVVLIVTSCYKYARMRNRITIVLILACPFLIVRGIYGVLSIFVPSIDYFNFSNYSERGMSNKFLVAEYCMSTTMEYVAASLLLLSQCLQLTINSTPESYDLTTENSVKSLRNEMTAEKNGQTSASRDEAYTY